MHVSQRKHSHLLVESLLPESEVGTGQFLPTAHHVAQIAYLKMKGATVEMSGQKSNSKSAIETYSFKILSELDKHFHPLHILLLLFAKSFRFGCFRRKQWSISVGL